MSVEDIGSQTLDLSLSRYVGKTVELNILRDFVNVTYNTLGRKKIALKTEQEQLDGESYGVRAAEDVFCNEIWGFTFKHNFNIIFHRYPDVIGIVKPRECPHCATNFNNGQKNHIVQDCEENVILKDLTRTIDAIHKEIISIQSENVEQEIKDALINLTNLKFLTREISELIRLINAPQASRESYNNSMCLEQQLTEYMNCHEKNANSPKTKRHFSKLGHNTAQSFISAQKLMKKCQRETGNVKFGKFVMKKQSHISLKYEENQKYVNFCTQSKRNEHTNI